MEIITTSLGASLIIFHSILSSFSVSLCIFYLKKKINKIARNFYFFLFSSSNIFVLAENKLHNKCRKTFSKFKYIFKH